MCCFCLLPILLIPVYKILLSPSRCFPKRFSHQNYACIPCVPIVVAKHPVYISLLNFTCKKCEFSVASDPKIAHLLDPFKVHIFSCALGVAFFFKERGYI
jgi:hypothetical protein